MEGNQLKYEGEVTKVNNIDINHGIEYEDDKWLIQEKNDNRRRKNERCKC